MTLARAITLWTGLLAGSAALAQTTVTTYGRLDLSMDSVETSTGRVNKLVDNASRLGFRVTEDMGGTSKALVGLEFGVSADSGALTSPNFRNSYVALQDSWGTLALGRLDSGAASGSPLYSMVVTHIGTLHDAGAPAFGTKVLNARNRFADSIGYRTPNLGPWTVRARLGFNGEGKTGAGITGEDSIKNLDVGVNYDGGNLGLAVGVAQDRKRGGLLANDFDKKWIALASYRAGSVRLYGSVGEDTYMVTSATRRGKVGFWLAGATATMGLGSVTANYMRREVQSDVKGELTKLSLSYLHRLSRRSSLFALLDDENANTNLTTGKVRTLSLGMQHNF